MKEDKARVKGEVQKMKDKQLSYGAVLDILELLMDGDVVKLGRILCDENADPRLSLVDVATRVLEDNLFLEAPTLMEVARTLGIKFNPEQWGADERFGSSKEQIDKLNRAEPFKRVLTPKQKATVREDIIFFKKYGNLLYMVPELSKEQKAELPKEEVQKRAFWAPFIEDSDATASLQDLYKWLVTLTWAWEEDAVLDERLRKLEKRTKMAHLQDQHAEALCLSQMMNRMDGVKTRKRELLLAKRRKEEGPGDVRVDVLPLIAFDKKTVVDAVSGRTSVAFVRTKSEFRFPTCR